MTADASHDREPHDHLHTLTRHAVLPTPRRLDASPSCTGRGVTIALLDSGFYPHPDLTEPADRILALVDVTGELPSIERPSDSESWHWHGTQTSVVALGNG